MHVRRIGRAASSRSGHSRLGYSLLGYNSVGELRRRDVLPPLAPRTQPANGGSIPVRRLLRTDRLEMAA
jgi:hypothetical protein